ncbi:hypothetical protein L5515_003337 [Caenorhabditis briggsae]|uniref:Uncharacterized protein n=1 Tax=Caenorhabditis briggsae TaxID=6238 RepID=A0AAE9EI82_CAEBR|nr:hypothetical protein L5515_003337 [Caenorhabditis briggsae]
MDSWKFIFLKRKNAVVHTNAIQFAAALPALNRFADQKINNDKNETEGSGSTLSDLDSNVSFNSTPPELLQSSKTFSSILKKNKEDEEENHREEKGLQEKRSDRMIPSSTRRYSIWAIPKFGTFFNNIYASIGFLEI